MSESTQARNVGLLDIFLVFASNLKKLVVIPFVVAVLAACWLTYLTDPIYTAKATFIPSQPQGGAMSSVMQSLAGLAGLAGVPVGGKNPIDQYVSLLQSNVVSDRLIAAYGLQKKYGVKTKEDARLALASNVKINAGKKDGLITIEVDDVEPARAADLANSYVAELTRLTSDMALTDAKQRRTFFSRQLDQQRKRLDDAQRVLQKTGFTAKTLRAEPRVAAEEYADLKAKLVLAEIKVADLRRVYTSDSTELKSAALMVDELRHRLRQLESAVENGSDEQYLDRYREFKYQEALYELYAKQLELARLDEASEGDLIQVVDRAYPPELKSKPRRLQGVLASFLGSLFIVLAFVLLKKAWENELNSPDGKEKFKQIQEGLGVKLSRGVE